MRNTHRPDLFSWSSFDEARDLDFNSWAWRRSEGWVLVDPLPLSDHDRAHIEATGSPSHVVVTNSDHARAAGAIAARYGASIVGPKAEEGALGLDAHRYVGDGDVIVEGLVVLEMHGSKTPGELALLLEGTTLITGDLVRGQCGGALNLLPDPKLHSREAAIESVRALLSHEGIEAVLVGDGWPVFRDGYARLEELIASLV